MQLSRIYQTKRKISTTIWQKTSIATVADHLLARWWAVRIHIVRGSGSIRCVCRRRICLKNGTVLIARNKETKQRTLTPVGISWTSSPMLLDNWCIITFLYTYITSIAWALHKDWDTLIINFIYNNEVLNQNHRNLTLHRKGTRIRRRQLPLSKETVSHYRHHCTQLGHTHQSNRFIANIALIALPNSFRCRPDSMPYLHVFADLYIGC